MQPFQLLYVSRPRLCNRAMASRSARERLASAAGRTSARDRFASATAHGTAPTRFSARTGGASTETIETDPNERRKAEDGGFYTKAEFDEFYGVHSGEQWAAALSQTVIPLTPNTVKVDAPNGQHRRDAYHDCVYVTCYTAGKR